ncbi:3-oxoacyl-ACP synthase [Gordonia sp. TBRC 11910]|uniref:3-oxoacyl-ACP synthase n=1 Tax=Gordonia asplenii TaxID=2725283 RepID=A0A848LC47_9ACTN|nr:3-oxoacyl-[acyl-carrier-protein] synthase III C-terminal domain-containing protein [Gordonia asplenii]NMO05138.1 3-oxoacyl-ACP synthase [Gordonia asplenii]
MTTVTVVDVASYVPEKRVSADYFDALADPDDLSLRKNFMFSAPKFRRHAAWEETNVDMMCAAIEPLTARHGAGFLDDVDLLMSHSQLPDLPAIGCGGDVARRLGIAPKMVLDIHNGGCASLILMMELARSLFATGTASKALLLNAENAAGTGFMQKTVRVQPQSAIPGDGATAVVIGAGDTAAAGPSDVLGLVCHQHSEFAGDMTGLVDPPRKYWEAGPGEYSISFTESKIARVLIRGNRLVPAAANDVAAQVEMSPSDADWLITNQPNRLFLRNWREALQIPPERHPDTFDEYGNVFGVGLGLTLDTAITDGRIQPGDVVLMSAFAHAGDFAAAGIIRWGGRPTPPVSTPGG